MSERLVVAKVRGLHGLRGDVRVEVLTDQPERRFKPGAVLFPEGGSSALTVASAAAVVDGPGWRVRFKEIADRSSAEALRERYLEVALGPEDSLAEGTYYWHELMGLEVTSPDGTVLGTVHDVYEVGETEAVVVRGGPAGEFDVPLVRALIVEFEPRAGRFVVDPAVLDLDLRTDADRAPRPRAPRRRQGSRSKPVGRSTSGSSPDPSTAGPSPDATD